MKNLLKNLALAALILAVASPAFAAAKKWKVNKDGTVDIELWYGAAVTEAGPPPTDWVAYKIIREKLGINLIATALPSSENDALQKINAAGAAGSLPDIFMAGDNAFQLLAKQRLLAEVDDMYPMMPNRTKIMYDKESREHSTINGKSYGLSQPGTIVRNEGVIIRADWLKKLELAVPKTTEEFLEVMKAFTSKDPDGNAKADTYGFGAFLETRPISEGLGTRFDPLMGAFGVAGTWNMTAKNAGLNIKKAEYFEALSYVKSIIDAKVIDPNWLAYKKDDFRASWKQGRFGIFREQNMALHGESNYAPFDNNFPNGDLVVIDPPVGPKGLSAAGVYEQSYRTYCLSAVTAGQTIKMKKGPHAGQKVSKKQVIADLLEWMSSDEGYYLLGYGVEGVNYVFDKNHAPTDVGIPDPKVGYKKSKVQPLTQLRNMVYYNGDAELASRYGPYVTAKSKKELSPLKTLRTMQSKPWTACSNVSKLPQPDADVERFMNQGISEFMTGKRQLTQANWKAWVAEFEKNGGKAWEDTCMKIAKDERLLK